MLRSAILITLHLFLLLPYDGVEAGLARSLIEEGENFPEGIDPSGDMLPSGRRTPAATKHLLNTVNGQTAAQAGQHPLVNELLGKGAAIQKEQANQLKRIQKLQEAQQMQQLQHLHQLDQSIRAQQANQIKQLLKLEAGQKNAQLQQLQQQLQSQYSMYNQMLGAGGGGGGGGRGMGMGMQEGMGMQGGMGMPGGMQGGMPGGMPPGFGPNGA